MMCPNGCVVGPGVVIVSALERIHDSKKLCKDCKWFNEILKKIYKDFSTSATTEFSVECPKTGVRVGPHSCCVNTGWKIEIKSIGEVDTSMDLDLMKKVVVVGDKIVIAEPVFPFEALEKKKGGRR